MINKKFISALLLVLSWPIVSFGQHSGIGVKGGVLASLTRSSLLHYDPLLGGTMGLYAPIYCGSRFEMQPELLVALQGSSFNDPENDIHWIDRQLYLQLPLTVKFFVSNTFNLQLGGKMGWLLWARTQTANGVHDSKDSYMPLDAGIVAGLGLDFISGTDLTLRYYNGLMATLVNDSTVYPRNNTLQLTVGYRFKQFKHAPRHGRRRGH